MYKGFSQHFAKAQKVLGPTMKVAEYQPPCKAWCSIKNCMCIWPHIFFEAKYPKKDYKNMFFHIKIFDCSDGNP